MKSQLLCALALAASATAAFAQDSESLTLQTSVGSYCSDLGSGAASLNLGELAGAEGYLVSAFSGATTYSVPTYYCNTPTTVTMAATPLLRTPALSAIDPAFTDRVDYTASLTWSGLSGAVQTASGAPATLVSSEPATGALNLTISDPTVPSDIRPLAGNYAAAVTLTVAFN